MTSIFYVDPELVIALNTKIIFVNPNDLQIFKEIALPDDLTTCGLAKATGGEEDAGDKNQETPSIKHVRMSPNRQLLAVTTTGQKALLLYQLRPEHAKLISVRRLARASSALAFNHDSTRLLVTDKTGDCYEYSCKEVGEEPKYLLGHLSVLYDVLWTQDEKYIVTCDRDDKIRVTNYPATHDIHSYCLGHKEFVSAIEFLDDTTLISISGDQTMKLWNFLEAEELTSVQLPAPGIKLALTAKGSDKYQAAVLLHQPNECVVQYNITKSPKNEWLVDGGEILNFSSIIPCNLTYAAERLYVAGIVNDKFALRLSSDSKPAPDNWLEMVEEQFQQHTWVADDISEWFKKRYDNVTEYLERKKRRIEENVNKGKH